MLSTADDTNEIGEGDIPLKEAEEQNSDLSVNCAPFGIHEAIFISNKASASYILGDVFRFVKKLRKQSNKTGSLTSSEI